MRIADRSFNLKKCKIKIMKKTLSLILIMIIFMINGTSVKATSGFLRKNSIVTCNGITYGQHGDGHWHVAVKTIDGRYNASGSPIASNPCTDINNVENSQNNVSTSASDSQSKQTSKVINKSGDNTLKSLKIDNENINISEKISYKTNQKSVNIEAVANDDKATLEYDKQIDLLMGENIVTIIVISENGNQKEYQINITRERELSDNTNIVVKVNETEITFINYENDDLIVSSYTKEINITYELEDKNAKVEINGNKNLKVGENEIIIKVIAENGKEQNYKLFVTKTSKAEEIIGFIMFIVIIIIIVHYLKNRKNSKNSFKINT